MAALAQYSAEERIGIGVAVAAHIALAGGLMWMAQQRDLDIPPPADRVEVSLATEVSLESTAPDPALESAASLAPEIADLPEPAEAVSVPPPEPRVAPTTTPRVAPTSRPTTRPTPAPTPRATASQRPRGSRLDDNFLANSGTGEGSRGAPAANFGPQERAALASAITRQLRPHWSAPSGVDVDQLVTVVSWRLNRDGSLSGRPSCVTQRGINDSNRPQASLHCERAIRAVQLAAPFNLPEQFYSRWDDLEWDFDRRL
ncbi:energy transducer TonB [Aurantiacibacter sediminis]|uniref:Energy transducer TonB n=1 Tax=Aurantiacibacter sediminis TaxID=2793064 RepID=A0ABS0N1S5_9SPHN|nr:energy transducer TonB [Aurantiacibacter sediminis]MBH5321913.1 energy transducer TonB [Aurantiacibacter sediminis]